MWRFVGSLLVIFATGTALAQSQPVRGAFPSCAKTHSMRSEFITQRRKAR
jgi:hypothetical protein